MNRTKLTAVIAALIFTTFSLVAQDQSGRHSVVKFSPSKLMRGEILFSYERMIAEQASLEVSFGPAISNVSPINFDHLFGTGSNASEASLLGFTFNVAARYYPLEDKDALEGFYISPVIGFNRLNYLYTDNYNNNGSVYNPTSPNALPDQRGYSNNSSFAFVFGSQKWLSNSFSLDMYVGTGLKMRNASTYYIEYVQDPITYNTTTSWSAPITSTDVQWFITGGIKIGIGFGKRN